MRSIALFTVLVLAQIGCAIAQTVEPTTQETGQETGQPATLHTALSQQSSLDQILDALDARGRDLRTLSANLRLTDTDPGLGDSTVRSGKFWLENLPDGSPRAHILFDRKETDNRAIEDKIEYALTDGKLVDRTYSRKAQATHVVLQPGEKMNLLKLGEGPFPLPIGQKRESVYAAFDVKKIDPAKDDPPDTVHILLSPKPDSSLARKFKTIDVWVNVHDCLPQRIATLSLNGSEMKQTDLSDVKVNAPLTDADLSLPKIDLSGWNLTEESYDPAGK